MKLDLPDLPMALWKENILTFLDRTSWNATLAADANLWRQKKGLILPPWPKSGKIRMDSTIVHVRISKEWLVIGCRDGSVSAWHVRDGSDKFRMRRHDGGEVLCLVLVRDDKWLISACRRSVFIWNLRDMLSRKSSPAIVERTICTPTFEQLNWGFGFEVMVTFQNYPDHILCGHHRREHPPHRQLSVWKLEEGPITMQACRNGKLMVQCLAVSKKHMCCVFGEGFDIQLYEYDHPKDLQEHPSRYWKAHEHRIKALAFSPDGDYIASSSLGFLHSDDEATIRLWNLNGEPMYKWSPRDSQNININALCFFTCHEFLLATGGMSGKIHLWDLTTPSIASDDDDEWYRPECVSPGKYGHDGDTAVYALATFGKTLVSGGRDHHVRFWYIDD